MRNQQTLASAVTCSGVGLHSGQSASITLRPAPPDTGVVFVNRKTDVDTYLSASIEHRVPTELCTAICGNGFQVQTIEHLLSALSCLHVDNVFIDVSASEVPVMDGSAAPLVRLIQSVGIVPQELFINGARAEVPLDEIGVTLGGFDHNQLFLFWHLEQAALPSVPQMPTPRRN